jgi:phage shock protein PspC (stress-responsive transcriptional regulator)
MTCIRCQDQLADGTRYCPSCGADQASSDRPFGGRRLTRSRTDGRIAGVCAGIADYLGVDPTLVRLVWIVLSIVPGVIIGGVLAYLLAWLIMPEANAVPSHTASGARLFRSRTDRKVAGVCGGLAEYLHVDPTPLRLLWVILTVLPGAIAGGLIAYIVAWIIIPSTPQPAFETAHDSTNPT